MKRVKLYVEGGGNSKEQHGRCREGFSKLLEKSGFAGRMPRIVAGGGRNATFDQFKSAMLTGEPDYYPMLLVDSEEPIASDNSSSWLHLEARDKWERPSLAADDQAQLMVTCMETWIMADRATLQSFFGTSLNTNPLLSESDLEQRRRDEVQEALQNATRRCGIRKMYRKGKRSFEILATLNPAILKQHLPHFGSFIVALEKHLK